MRNGHELSLPDTELKRPFPRFARAYFKLWNVFQDLPDSIFSVVNTIVKQITWCWVRTADRKRLLTDWHWLLHMHLGWWQAHRH